MTRATSAHKPRAISRAVLLLPIMALTALFAACSSSTQQSEVSTELTGPAAPVSTASVAFAPVAAPGSVSSRLGSMLSAQAEQQSLNVSDEKSADYTVRGYLVAAEESEGTKVSYIWDITNKAGKRAQRFSGEEMVAKRVSGDPWAAVDDEAMRKIAASTIQRIAGWLPRESAPAQVATTGSLTPPASTATPQRASLASASSASTRSARTASASTSSAPAKVVVAVPEISGAPGDGGTALPDAMRRHLRERGIELTETPASGTYVVRGTVTMGNTDSGKQPIEIRWVVLDPQGKPLKNAVVQRNTITPGSLNGPWGRVADLAAGEAAKAISEILPKPTS